MLIIYKATRFSESNTNSNTHTNSASETQRNKRKTQMTRMILLITSLFIAMSLPGAILTGFFYDQVIMLEFGQVIVNLINGIQFSYPAFNFVILFFSNKLFAQELRSLLGQFKFMPMVNSASVTNTNEK